MSTGAASRNRIRIQVLGRMAAGVVVAAIPVSLWYKSAHDERVATIDDVRTRIRVPNLETSDDRLLEKCRAGDVILFDRRCEKCAAGPWAATACLAQRRFLCDENRGARSVGTGKFDHIGIVVPGYIKTRHDAVDPTNLLLLEATPSGIVARPLRDRLESTSSRSVTLLQLACPGDKRNLLPDEEEANDPLPIVERATTHVERELTKFRDTWIALGEEKGYKWIHSTVGLGGAMAYGLGMQEYLAGPTSPAAYLALMGLQQASAAQNLNQKEHQTVKVEDFLRDYRFEDANAVRLRPGWRFLAPIPMRENARS